MNCCACNRPCISAYTQQLCAIKSKLSLIEDLQAEMNSANSKKGCDCSCCCCSMQLALISLLKDIIDKCVTEDEFNEYKRWIEAQGYLKAIPDYYITEEELKEILKNLFRDGWNRELQAILEDYVKKADLPDYIRRWMDQNLANYLANYVTRPELNNYYTKALIDSMFGDYYTKAQVDALLRGLQTELPDLSVYALKGDFGWSPNPEIETATGRYKLGEIVLAGKTYSVYGKDNLGSGNNGLNGSDGQSGSSGSDGQSGSSTTDIAEIERVINDKITEVQLNVLNTNYWANEYVKDIIAQALLDADWFRRNTIWGEIWTSGGANWSDVLKAFIQQTALVDKNGNEVQWSTFYQDYKQVKAEVNALKTIYDEEDNPTNIDQLINERFELWQQENEGGITLTSLATLFSVQDGNTLKEIIKFALAGLNTYSQVDGSGYTNAWAQLFANAQDNTSGTALDSEVRAYVDQAAGTAMAHLVSDATLYKILRDSNGNPILRNYNGNKVYMRSDGTYNTDYPPLTVIYLDANGNELSRTAPLNQRVVDLESTSGLVTEANLRRALATVFAQYSDNSASITAWADSNRSLVDLMADEFWVSAANTTFTGNVRVQTGQSQTAASGGEIYLGKDGNSKPIFTVTAPNTVYPTFAVYTNDLLNYNNPQHDAVKNAFFSDGSARLASGNMTWTSSGSLAVKDINVSGTMTFVDSLNDPLYVDLTLGGMVLVGRNTIVQVNAIPGELTGGIILTGTLNRRFKLVVGENGLGIEPIQ